MRKDRVADGQVDRLITQVDRLTVEHPVRIDRLMS
jgi:hypothetical protein